MSKKSNWTKRKIILWVLLNQYKYIQQQESEIIFGPTATCSPGTSGLTQMHFLVHFLKFREKVTLTYFGISLNLILYDKSIDNWCKVIFVFYFKNCILFSNCCELKVQFEKWMISASETPIWKTPAFGNKSSEENLRRMKSMLLMVSPFQKVGWLLFLIGCGADWIKS